MCNQILVVSFLPYFMLAISDSLVSKANCVIIAFSTLEDRISSHCLEKGHFSSRKNIPLSYKIGPAMVIELLSVENTFCFSLALTFNIRFNLKAKSAILKQKKIIMFLKTESEKLPACWICILISWVTSWLWWWFVFLFSPWVWQYVIGKMQHVDKNPIKYFKSWKYPKPLIYTASYGKWFPVIEFSVFPVQSWLMDIFRPSLLVCLNNVTTWGVGYKCSSFYVWDSRGFELRPSMIYCLAPYQSLNMQIVLIPTRAMADSLRPNGSLSLEGSSRLPPPILYTGYFMWANQFLCYLSFLSSLNCWCLFQLIFTE